MLGQHKQLVRRNLSFYPGRKSDPASLVCKASALSTTHRATKYLQHILAGLAYYLVLSPGLLFVDIAILDLLPLLMHSYV